MARWCPGAGWHNRRKSMTYAFVGHRNRPTRSLDFLPRVSNRKRALTAGFFGDLSSPSGSATIRFRFRELNHGPLKPRGHRHGGREKGPVGVAGHGAAERSVRTYLKEPNLHRLQGLRTKSTLRNRNFGINSKETNSADKQTASSTTLWAVRGVTEATWE
jgi:hypothetical protein